MTPQRADARQNRASLLVAAARVFAERGPDVALDLVAREAGVSIATLYRHFPHREALVAETYRREIDELGEVEPLLAGRGGADALAAWVARFVEFARTKRALADLVHALPEQSRPPTREILVGALAAILDAGVRDGTLRGDLDAEDVLATLAGFWTLPGDGAEWSARAERLARFVVDGVRT